MKKERNLPEVDLFTDSHALSRLAKRLLEKNRITFAEYVAGKDYHPEPGFLPPVLNSRAGQYRGLRGIKDYIIVSRLGK